ncbi:MAG: glycosyltransferase [Candidatus Peribacteria bacterium]|jgi:glycosyltransferase involved in cell wall biosynthesis|nr:glycosyltransferase [Candidatus Peribacteria bacterium]
MLGLLYYGRLEKEKGFDSLLEAIRILNGRNSSLPPHSSSSVQNDRAVPQFELFIFGKGTLESELLPLVGQNVHFFGFQPLSKIRQYVENVDYCLMPSEFLETFGLVALNALSWGLPVIGYKK